MADETTSSSIRNARVADELERLIIEVVQRHPILYDRTHKFHNCSAFPAAHHDAWRRISAEMRLEVGSCKSLWLCIKQKFIKYRKRIATGDAVSKEWPQYDVIYSWLDEHIQKRRSRVQICKLIQSSPDEKATPLTRLISQEHQDLIDTFDTAEFTELPDNKPSPSTKTQHSIRIVNDMSAVLNKQDAPSNKRKASTKTLITDAQPKRKMKVEIVNDERDSTDAETDDVVSTYDNNAEVSVENTEIPLVESESPKLDTSNGEHKLANGHEPIIQAVGTLELTNSVSLPAVSDTTSSLAKASLNNSMGSGHVIDFGRLESVIGQCVGLVEQCALRQRTQDPDEVFGTLIASMVRELPAERRRNARVQILELAGDLLAKLV